MLLAVAVGAYLIGRDASRSAAPAASATRSAVVANVLVEYPSDWKRAASAPIGGFTLSELAVFAPPGRASQAGLLVGALRAGEMAPLPRSLLRSLLTTPQAAVVSMPETQAYRYSNLRGRTFAGSMTVYAIPKPGGQTTIAACYASSGAGAFLARCAGIVAGITQLDQTQSEDLTPQPAYASRLASVVGELDLRRSEAAGARRAGATWANLTRLANQLSASFARSRSALAALEPPPPAGSAQAALSRALDSASAAYAELASAAGLGDSEMVLRARGRARAAEALVDEALAVFALLGYGSGPAAKSGGQA